MNLELIKKIPDAESLYQELLEKMIRQYAAKPFFLAGLASGGVWIAERLAKDLLLPSLGVINVSFHRDDYADKGIKAFNSAAGMATKLPFKVDGAYIILVDDVLSTGRTVRAALNELFDYGRPAKVDLAVLVDRHHRELPIEASFKAGEIELPANEILSLEKDMHGEFKFFLELKSQENIFNEIKND